MSEREKRAFALLNDQPVGSEQDDLLGTHQAADSLAELILASKQASPFTIGIDAGWGMGKSSLLLQLEHQLCESGEVATAWFNAWTADGKDALEALIKAVLLNLDETTLRRALRRISKGQTLLAAARIALIIVFGVFGLSRVVDEIWKFLNVDTKGRGEIRQEISTMITDWRSSTKRTAAGKLLAVFVDDLDRCSSQSILAICEGIKLYLDVPGLIFLVACDQSVLVDATNKASNLSDSVTALDYLEKIIQVTYHKPAPDSTQIGNLIQHYADESGTADLISTPVRNIVAERTGRNPRRIKRLINGFVLEYHLDASWRTFDSSVLGALILLQHFYAEFYRQFSRPNGNDLVSEFLAYVEIRDRLQMSHPLTDYDAEYFETHHVRPAEQFSSSFEALEHLERELPISFPDLARDADFIVMLRSLVDAPDFERLRRHVQSRPSVALDVQVEATRALRTSREWQALLGLQVMWINDHPLVIERDADELKRAGAKLLTCANIGEAREQLPSFRPDVLISDVSRHGDDGAGFRDLEILTDEGLYAGPVIFYTARITPSRRSRAMSLGASITSSRTHLFDSLLEIAATTARFERPSAFLAREQRTTLEMLIAGEPLEGVADRLGTSEEHVVEIVAEAATRWQAGKNLDAADKTLIEAAAAAKLFERFSLIQ